jgi:hypothetical protein
VKLVKCNVNVILFKIRLKLPQTFYELQAACLYYKVMKINKETFSFCKDYEDSLYVLFFSYSFLTSHTAALYTQDVHNGTFWLQQASSIIFRSQDGYVKCLSGVSNQVRNCSIQGWKWA